MRQDVTKQKPKFHLIKTLAAWALVPGLGVPATKFVESYYDVSLFSPIISGMWNGIQSVGSWMILSVSLPLWMLALITVLALLMVGVVVWVIIDANGKLKDADEELDDVNAKLRELISTGAKLSASQAELKSTQAELDVHKEELKAAYAKIADFHVPKVAPLTDEQDKVIATIAAYDNSGKRCLISGIPAAIELTLLQAASAIDVLAQRKLISVMYPPSGKYATLTAAGRAYVLNQDFKHSHAFLRR